MRKPNNKGFSMTEVIVAVAVFLILAIPIFSQLVLSVKNNSKAKASQYGINVAESEMELFKSVDLNAVAKIYSKIENPDGTFTYSLPSIYVDTNGKILETDFMANPYATASLMEFADKVREFKMDTEGVCTFSYDEELSNAETAAAEDVTDTTFEVTVALDPTGYDGDSGESNYNNINSSGVQSLNKDKQAIIGTNLSSFDDDVREDFWKEEIISGLTNQEAYIYKESNYTTLPTNYRQWNTFYMHRTTYITIALNEDPLNASKGEYVVTTDYVYDCSYKVAGITKAKTYTKSENKLYFNTVPDVKFYYNQLIVSHVKPNAGDIIFSDEVVFTNKLLSEKKHVEGFTGHGYEYYFTNSDLYFAFNNEPGSCRGYSSSNKCVLSFGADHHDSQKPLNVYYTQTSADSARSITNILKAETSLATEIVIKSADEKKVVQDFQPIYDITVEVSPKNKNGMETEMKGTRGQ
ncbi:MAG: type II secretion system protein [Lachnospiraceae bacterium]|nr:type II secretion system protein [Lachnospiraceae bacterium]